MTTPPAQTDLEVAALQILRRLTKNPHAEFRPGQLEAITALVERRQHVLVVQRTGWGKSAVYFVAALLLRAGFGSSDRPAHHPYPQGPAIIVSPLLSLMRNQIAAATQAGVVAVTINSGNAEQWDAIAERIRARDVDVLLISPERLVNTDFQQGILQEIFAEVSLLVVDEAHCISDWGHDFRPDYRRIRELINTIGADLPVLATTATANTRVMEDVAAQLGAGTVTLRGPLSRASLQLGVGPVAPLEDHLAWLVDHVADMPGSGIIYTLTVNAAEDTAALLSAAGITAHAYTGRTDAATREALEAALIANEVKVLVATSALGMGFDKPDLGFVIHLGAPSSAVAYYQQVGRAGRATKRAQAILLPSPSDAAIWAYFATAAMPAADTAYAVLAALQEATTPLSIPQLEQVVGVKRSRLELLLKTLHVEGAVAKAGGKYQPGPQPNWEYDHARYAAVAKARRAEADAMRGYITTSECRMVYLAHQLDDFTAQPCGICDRCQGPFFPTTIGDAARKHLNMLQSAPGIVLEVRKRWPNGLRQFGIDYAGIINEQARAEPGRAVARATDLGLGQRLRELVTASDKDQPLPAELHDAIFATLHHWDWDTRPTVVVGLPPREQPQLGHSLVKLISSAGRIPFAGSLRYTAGAGSRDVNSTFRVKHLANSLVLPPEVAAAVTGETVLLVDVDTASGWTFTVAAALLKDAGAQAVLPFALLQSR
ncbi:RecQ family ATP-dependent DNA helicase [Corynebacterium choanae]|uniref:DNA 3'-5' helicase n=1 Tax=Corynebacterium choanae TaxID=1862358 RepID=A0A3G6J6X5_9CORY|nr:RecQ family ATP-dependent DNA helicase [Corynebacterium choanae]AZA12678.1 ATP-dependent DNA helicase RecQ [Corynebacterium choanae]